MLCEVYFELCTDSWMRVINFICVLDCFYLLWGS